MIFLVCGAFKDLLVKRKLGTSPPTCNKRSAHDADALNRQNMASQEQVDEVREKPVIYYCLKYASAFLTLIINTHVVCAFNYFSAIATAAIS